MSDGASPVRDDRIWLLDYDEATKRFKVQGPTIPYGHAVRVAPLSPTAEWVPRLELARVQEQLDRVCAENDALVEHCNSLVYAKSTLSDSLDQVHAALKAEQEAWEPVLRGHYLAAINCDHDRHMDQPVCACSIVALGWHPSVGAAVAAWASHVGEVVAESLVASGVTGPTIPGGLSRLPTKREMGVDAPDFGPTFGVSGATEKGDG